MALSESQNGSRKQSVLGSFSCALPLTRVKFDVVMKQFNKLDLLIPLTSNMFVVKGNICCFNVLKNLNVGMCPDVWFKSGMIIDTTQVLIL